MYLLFLVFVFSLLLNTSGWEPVCFISSKSGSSSISQVINTITCWHQMLLGVDVMKKTVKGGRELRDDVKPLWHQHKLIPEKYYLGGVFMLFFLFWFAERTLEVFSLYGGCCSLSQKGSCWVPCSNCWTSTSVCPLNICIPTSISYFFLKLQGVSLWNRIGAVFSYTFPHSNVWI